jgi:hypothetical protein
MIQSVSPFGPAMYPSRLIATKYRIFRKVSSTHAAASRNPTPSTVLAPEMGAFTNSFVCFAVFLP